MGLDTTHNCWHGPYSSFNNFRRHIARRAGIELNDYREFKIVGQEGLFNKSFAEMPDTNLKPLFAHSDCDGELTPAEAEQIAEGLTQVLSKISDDFAHGYPGFKQEVMQFRDGCLKAAAANETIIFR